MGKVVDITEKLGFEENPKLKVKDVELEVNALLCDKLGVCAEFGHLAVFDDDQLVRVAER